jgi:hypothetical protein
MHHTTRGFGLLLAAALSLTTTSTLAADAAALPTSASPANATQPEAAAGTVQELDEIMVRGKKIKQLIADAEDEFFSVFNDVNTDDDYDTSCVYLSLDTEHGGSNLKSRVCMPGFVADAMADWAVSKVECTDFNDHDSNFDGRISVEEASEDDDLNALFYVLDKNHDHYLSAMEYSERNMPPTPGCYQPPPPQLVLMEGTQKWYEHSMQVIKSDPRLQKMAGHLDDLYHELYAEESKLNAAQAQREANAVPVVAKPNPGPRAR